MTAPPSALATPRRAGFRTDLAGLRGVAVLLVAIYHVWVGRVSGGVDVFLLMSAFFLTGGWVRSVESGRGRGVISSWIKRLRGLLPSAAVVIGAVLLLGLLILPSTRWPELLSQSWASLGYTQNVHLSNISVDYYNPDHSNSSPLQHFWSLSVQGQVFLLWPLLLGGAGWVAKRAGWGFRRVVGVLFGLVFLASFIYSVIHTARDQSDAYFSTPARLWEFALGSLLALVADRAVGLPAWLARTLGWLGMLALVSCGMLLQVEGQFPGYAALWPTLAAAAIVVAGSGTRAPRRTDVGWWLSRRPATWLGKVSYPLYLWHWPLLVFALFLTGREHAGFWLGTLILSLALVLAWLTHRFVEIPAARWASRPVHALDAVARRSRTARLARVRKAVKAGTTPGGRGLRARTWGGIARQARPIAVVLLSLSVALPVALWQASLATQTRNASTQTVFDNPGAATLEPGYAGQVPNSAVPVPLPAEVKEDWAMNGEDCSGAWAPSDEVITFCHEGGDLSSSTTVLIVGDSHAQQWTPSLDGVAQSKGWHWVAVYRPGCRYGSTEEGAADADCAAYTEAAKAYVTQRLASVDAIVTVATKTVAVGSDGRSAGEDEKVVPGYVEAVKDWLDAGVPVVGVRDTPRFPFDPAECVAKLTTTEQQCGVQAADQLAAVNPLTTLTSGPGRLKGLSSLDMTDVVCPDGFCSPVIGNVNVWIDDSHLTSHFATSAGVIFGQRLTAALRW